MDCLTYVGFFAIFNGGEYCTVWVRRHAHRQAVFIQWTRLDQYFQRAAIPVARELAPPGCKVAPTLSSGCA